MMNRPNSVLAILAVVQLALALVVLWPRSGPASASGPLFPDLAATDVTALTITDGSETLSMRLQGGDWLLASSDDFPVTKDTVDAILEKILATQTSRLVARTNSSHRRLQVADDDYVRRVDFTAGGSQYTLFVGSSPNVRATHVRASGQAEVYLSADLTAFDLATTLANWIDVVYLSPDSNSVSAVTLENAQGRFEFTKTGDSWSMVGLAADELLDSSGVITAISRLSSLRMLRPLGRVPQPAYGMETPLAVISLVSQPAGAEASTITLTVGAQDPTDQSFVVKSSASDYYVRVASFAVETLVNSQRTDFVQEPAPELEATPTTAP